MTLIDDAAAVNGAEPRPAAAPAAGVRCSNADREQIAGLMHAAAGDGRLTMDEAEERLGQVYAARYHHELEALTADLALPSPSPVGWALVFATVRRQVLDDLAALLGRAPATRARRIGTAGAALALLLVVAGMAYLVLHGIMASGHEFGGHGFGGNEFGEREFGPGFDGH